MVRNFVFLGAPGVGKGSISQKVMRETGIIHISTGDIFRTHIKNQTKLGRAVAKFLASGQYVPDAIVNEVVRKRLRGGDVQEHGFILDGYPRTIDQAKFLNSIINEAPVQVVLLEASDAVITARLAKRAREENRPDDSHEVIRDRVVIYTNKTAPLINYYESQNQLVKINAEAAIGKNVQTFYRECLVDHDKK